MADAIASVDRLVHYCQHLDTLLHNFVSLRDFYSAEPQGDLSGGHPVPGRPQLRLVCRRVGRGGSQRPGDQADLPGVLRLPTPRRSGKMTIAAAFAPVMPTI